LQNLYGDNTYLKDYLSYLMMNFLEVPSPLYGFAFITVNSEVQGLYGMVERYNDSWIDRNYDDISGELYNVKQSGRQGNDDLEDFFGNQETTALDAQNAGPTASSEGQFPFSEGQDPNSGGMTPPAMGEGSGSIPGGGGFREGGGMPSDGGGGFPEGGGMPGDGTMTNTPGGIGGGVAGGGGVPNDGSLSNTPGGIGGGVAGGGGFGGNNGGDLVYQGESTSSYSAIFENAVSNISASDQEQVIRAIEALNSGTDLETYWDVDEILRYLAVHTFLVNLDSYSGQMQQNYYLYERNGQIQILPWDYNHAFGGFGMGMGGGGMFGGNQPGDATSAGNDATFSSPGDATSSSGDATFTSSDTASSSSDAASFVNFPIDTPVASGIEMSNRPLINVLLSIDEYQAKYHQYLKLLSETFVLGGFFDTLVDNAEAQIDQYLTQDSTAFVSEADHESSLPALKLAANLRANSILGQIEGKIPATYEAQEENPQALLDASSLNLSLLGGQGSQGRN
jgi:hypothetical protein